MLYVWYQSEVTVTVYWQEGVSTAEVTLKEVEAALTVQPVELLLMVAEMVDATYVKVEVYHQSSDAFKTFRVAPLQY